MIDANPPMPNEQIPPSPTPEQIAAYRARGRILPLCGIASCILFSLLVPLWCSLGAVASDEAGAFAVLGVIPSLLAIPFHILGSKFPACRVLWYAVSILLNTAGVTLCMTAYYVFLGARPSSALLLAGALPSVAIYLLTALLMNLWPRRYPLLTGLVALLTVALLVVSIIFWIKTDNKVFFSFAFFNLLWTLISVCALHVACSDETSPALRFASFCSFGILLGVAAIVLVILACAAGDCDCSCDSCDSCCDCDGCDCNPGDGKSTDAKPARKQRKHR